MNLQQLQDDLDQSPYHNLFEMKILSADADQGRLSVRQAFTASVERSPGSRQYHGGAIASLIDIAGDYALMLVLGYGVPTIDFRVDYLRPAIDTDLVAAATVRKQGKTIGVVDIDVTDEGGRLVAVGRGCYATVSG